MEKKGWKLIDPGSAAGLDGSIAKAADLGEPWFWILLEHINGWKI